MNYNPGPGGTHAGIFICGNEFFAPGGVRRPLTEAERASTAKESPEAVARVAALAALPPGVDYSSLYGPAGFDARLYVAANRLPDELRPQDIIDDNAASWASPLDPRTAPGLIGFATREHEQYRAKRQTPIPGYLAHLLATSTIMGLAFRGTFKDAPDYANLQILGLLPSLFGKEDIVSEIYWALNLARSLGMRLNFSMGYASGPAIHTAFSNDPYQCSLEDEAGRKAQQQRKGGGDLHQSGVVTFFMEMFARYFIVSRPYATNDNRKPMVPHAYATQLRLSQPETLAPTLEKANVTDGQLNRPYFVYEPKVPPKHPYGERTYQAQSDALTRAYTILAHWALPANLAAAAHADNEVKAARDERYVWQVLPAPLAIPVVPTPEAETVYKHFDNWCERQVQAGFPIWGRAGQHVKRFAMVLAVGEEALRAAPLTELPPAPITIPVSAETMRWACAEIAGRLRSLGLFAKEEIHGADLDGKIAAAVMRALKKDGGRLIWSKLWNTVQKNTGEDTARVKRVILALVEMEQLVSDNNIDGTSVPRGTRISLPK